MYSRRAISLRIPAEEKAMIQEAEYLQLSERDSLRVLAALESPRKPNAKLLAAAESMSKPK